MSAGSAANTASANTSQKKRALAVRVLRRTHVANVSSSHRSARSDRKSTRLNSSHSQISYAAFCLKNKNVGGEHGLGIQSYELAGGFVEFLARFALFCLAQGDAELGLQHLQFGSFACLETGTCIST